ncbi:hypothetical protein BO78DRAFT_396448 [Aspergillus sclerotiicarbonarius CBS 121057]|uniref:Uncharacterized protein n=1 Tax=Aspergillus sclerotiicarbonarius (strain CBS 121057 / IBT 28362) TaxID=1448318 RepID=A0A319EI75_ASPSB|nr:hypothetical protein BO78DRAFT_396448 [Aspergillus sclerotiicarbonarius CBS 121057]
MSTSSRISVRTMHVGSGLIDLTADLEAARAEVKKHGTSRALSAVDIYNVKGPGLLRLANQFAKGYQMIPEAIARGVGKNPHDIQPVYEVVKMKRGWISIQGLLAFVMIRLSETDGGLSMRAFSKTGSEDVAWTAGDIVEISGADGILLEGEGTWAGIAVGYK